MRNWKLRSSVIVLAAVMMASSGCGKKNNDTASLPQLPSQTQTQEQTQEQTIEQTIPVTTEEEAIPVPVAPGEVNVSSSSSASASSLAATSSQAVQAEDGYEPRDEEVYATQKVNIREAASTDAAKAGSLEAGASIHRIGYTAEWSKVEYNGTTCYIASEYLSDKAPETVNQQVQAPSAATELWSGDLSTLSTNEFSGIADYRDRDALNVPNGCYYLNKLYGKYNAKFIEDTSKKVIYLTMDEGYEAGFTPQILQTLREKNVKATFFVTKEFYDSNPEYIKQMIDDGHTVGNHTCNHKNMPSLSLEEQTNEIMVLHNLVKDNFGYEMKLFRFPEGSTSEQSLGLVESLGYQSVFWSFHYLDYNSDAQKDPAEALQLCMDSIHPGAIYLLHAKSATNTQILAEWIDAVRAAGYEFGGGLPTTW